MGKQYTTAMGKSIDMEALALRNEKVRAVGNMNVNARGDIIDSNNQIINDVTKRVNGLYNKTTVNPGSTAGTTPIPGRTVPPQQQASAPTAEPAAKRTKRVKKESDMTVDEQSEFNEFNEPNPRK